MLSIGSRGQSVVDLQRRLAALGFDVGRIDGIFGPQTRQAVLAFQASQGIGTDGIVGPITEGALSQSGAPQGGNVEPQAPTAPRVPPGTPGVAPQRTVTPLIDSTRPEESPEFQAFLRGLGTERSRLASEIRTRIGRLESDLATARSATDFGIRQDLANVAGSFEGRGLFRSGERQVQQDVARAGREREFGAVETDISRRIADARLARTRGFEDIDRQREERGLAERRSLLQRKAENIRQPLPGLETI